MTSVTPSGRRIKVRPRAIDLKYAEELERFPGVTSARSPEELDRLLRQCFGASSLE
jgi:flavoprotein